MTSPVVIGVNGMDCTGKTTFAAWLCDELTRKKIKPALLHVDDFNNHDVQKLIYDAHEKGEFTKSLLELYYHNSIHYDALAKALIRSRCEHDVTLIEGVFLFKDSLDHLLDIRIFLPIAPDAARRNYQNRRRTSGDKRPLGVFDDIWRPAHERYCGEVQPEEKSDFIIRT